jgi:predicted ArsR family transcriptional regulator
MNPDSALSAVSGTKRQILDHLKQHGAAEAQTLADAIALTDMAIRQHLYALQDAGLVAYEEERRPKGRPAKLWRLTPAADEHFPDAHAELAVALVDDLIASAGETGMDQLLAARRQRLIRDYRARLEGKSTLRSRLAGLAGIRAEEGYMAEVVSHGRGVWLLVENHCPICAAASACQGFCAVELEVFRAVLGPEVAVERVDHILAGARRCAYRIAPR